MTSFFIRHYKLLQNIRLFYDSRKNVVNLAPVIYWAVHRVKGKGMGDIVILTRYMFQFIRGHENLVQDPSNNKSSGSWKEKEVAGFVPFSQ